MSNLDQATIALMIPGVLLMAGILIALWREKRHQNRHHPAE